jgi:hypothetical protein
VPIGFQVKCVEHTMHDGGEDDAGGHDQRQAAVEGIAPRECIAAGGLERFKRPRPGQDHGGIRKRVEPGHPFQEVMAGHADE